MTRFDGKVAVVTGAAQGIGDAIASLLAENGARVLMTDLMGDQVADRAAALREAGHTAIPASHDVADEAAWAGIVALAEQHWGRIDILVNNAGISMFGLVTELTTAQWKRCIAVDLDSVFYGTRAVLPIMRRGGGGSIINISSIAGIAGQPNLSAYCAAKGGVRLFSKAVALECAAARDGVRVNSVHPGIIDTPIFHNVAPDAAVAIGTLGDSPAIDIDALAAHVTPMGRAGLPQEVASAVAYLASDDSRFVTGTELVVDGGYCAG